MNVLDRLLAGREPDPDGGPPLAVPVCSVALADSLAGQEDALVAALALGARLAVVSDPTTHAILGARVERALGARCVPVRLPEGPRADTETAARLASASATADALIAVGSGTINDLCKYVAAEAGKPYAVFGTAPSMNGYASMTAAIMVDGLKRSLPARPPVGVFLDLAVLAAAPPRMICSGLGDSLCRPAAQADWLLSHRLRGTPYRAAPFRLLAEDEEALFAESGALLRGDLAAMARLARTLLLSGFGMTLCGSSHPASQGEHLIAHYLEMMAPDLPLGFHGEQIGVTTLAMARLYERLLAGRPPRLKATRTTRADLEAHFGPALGASCWAEFAPKRLDRLAAAALNERLAAEWPDICAGLAAVLRPAAVLEAALRRAGAPTTPAALGCPPELFAAAVGRAREIRNRYTALDLAADARLPLLV
ncbi:MAG: sn-glycerol-1-phosphate dehydrogenase [Alphaproteobacteria bacterium]|nr:sn-glycerol-1-phosphate dehydrogenase [Alphaproteobacteria bacterium]